MTASIRQVLVALACAAGIASSACGNGSTSTSPSTATATKTTEYFSGTLAPGGVTFYSFSVASAGDVSITLASLSSSTVGPAVPSTLTVGIGLPSGFGCATTSTVDTSAGLTAQLAASGAKDNIYCVNVSDPGSLASDVTFVVRIVHT